MIKSQLGVLVNFEFFKFFSLIIRVFSYMMLYFFRVLIAIRIRTFIVLPIT